MRESKRPGDRAAYEERLTVRTEIPELRAHGIHLGCRRGPGPKRFSRCWNRWRRERRKRIGTGGYEPFSGACGFRARFRSHAPESEDSVFDAGVGGPPTFVLFTNRDVKLHFSYQRFLENQIRDAFGFVGTPIWIKNRARNA